MGKDKIPGRLERTVNLIPLVISYGILFTTWLGFIWVVSIHEILIRRHQTSRFVEQLIVFNTLSFLTIISLITASNRSPGRPNPLLAPTSQSHTSHSPKPARIDDHNLPTTLADATSDDIPLKFLKNAQWVTTRGGKVRPSPLPLRSTPIPVQRRLQQKHGRDTSGDAGMSGGGGGFEGVGEMLAISPFVPRTPGSAGEDTDEQEEITRERLITEGSLSPSDGVGEELEEGEEDALLSKRRDVDNRRGGAGKARRAKGRKSVMVKSNKGESRWCAKCEVWKPDRCHHCRFCRVCTLKMDHHCVWIGNCVGYNNYKPFLLFITYGSLLALYTCLESTIETLRFFAHPDDYLPNDTSNGVCVPGTVNATTACSPSASSDEVIDLAPVLFMCLAILGGFFALAVGSLTGYHWYLASQNKTTLEDITHTYPSVALPNLDRTPPCTSTNTSTPRWKPDHVLSRSERNRLRTQARGLNIYDLGWKRNLDGVFLGTARGDGGLGLVGLLKCAWPLGGGFRKEGAGHYFEYDEGKLERLRGLTWELRVGSEEERPYFSEREEDDDDDWDGGGGANEVEEGLGTGRSGWSGSGVEGDVEDEDNDDDAEEGEGERGKVKWFDD